MLIYRVIPYRVWVHAITGARASIYGACPWPHSADKPNWSVQQQGFTVENLVEGTVGVGRPWATAQEAQAWVDAKHARLAACRRALGLVA